MNKTVNINLGGIFFHIDEDAYKKLKKYLDSVRNSLSDDPQGKDEIINDIEIRISEILSERIKDVRQVVNIKDVESIIEIMGKPEDYNVDEDLFSDEIPSNNKKLSRKKLYRDPDDKFLGGVCSGLAHYFNIDVIWVRLFWLFFALTYGSGVLIYLLLWILLPVANTTSEKLEMEGEEVNISNIEKKIKEEFKDVSNRFKEGVDDFTNEIKKGNYETRLKTAIQEIVDVFSKIFSVFFKFFGKIIGVLILLISGIVLLSLIISVFSIGSIEFLNIDSDIVQYPPFFLDATIPKGLLGVALAMLAGIPFFFLFVLGLKIISSNVKPLQASTKLILAGVWFVSLLLIVITGIESNLKYSNNVTVSKNEIIQINDKDTLKIKMKGLNDWYLNKYHSKIILDGDDEKLYKSDISLIIKPSDDDSVKITVYKKASAITIKKAKKTADDISYNYSFDENNLTLDAYYLLDTKHKYGNQSVKILIEVPKGKVVELDTSVRNFLRYSAFVDKDASFESRDKLYVKVTDSGIECLNCLSNENNLNNIERDISNKYSQKTENKSGVTQKYHDSISKVNDYKEERVKEKTETNSKKRVLIDESGVHVN